MVEDSRRQAAKETEIKEYLLKKGLDIPVYYFTETTSTMDAAKSIIKTSPANMAVFISDIQKAGRGRQMREWESIPGNFFITYAFQIGSDISKFSGFSLVAGLACANYLASIGARTRLKWPNDILSLSLKKLGGILIEISQEGSQQYLFCGIGINLVANPSGIENTTNIKEVTGVELTPSQAATKLTPVLKTYFDKFISCGFSAFRGEWNQIAAFIGREIKVHISKDRVASGMLMGVGSDGSLQIEKNGKIDTLTAGDVSLNEE